MKVLVSFWNYNVGAEHPQFWLKSVCVLAFSPDLIFSVWSAVVVSLAVAGVLLI